MLHFEVLSMLPIILLLLLSQVASRALDTSLVFPLNRSIIIDQIEASNNSANSANSTTYNSANDRDFIGLTRVAKIPTAFIKNGLNSARKVRKDLIIVHNVDQRALSIHA
jgi:hypothetical protein